MPGIVMAGFFASVGWAKYLVIYMTSVFKYLAGVGLAYGAAQTDPDFGMLDILLTAGLGGITGVVVFTYFGKSISGWVSRRFKRSKPLSFKRRRMIVSNWQRYGILGVAILTPFISPPIAVAIALAFDTHHVRHIIAYFSSSIAIWSLLFAVFQETFSKLLGA